LVPPCPGPPGSQPVLDLGLYLDGILPEAEMRTVERHLFTCDECRSRIGSLRDLETALEDRALWRAGSRPTRLDAEDTGTSCLSAAEMLLALEGKASAQAERHLASCAGCTQDVLAIEESTEEHALGRLERPDAELLEILRGVGKQATDDQLAPVTPISPASRVDPDTETSEVKGTNRRVAKRVAPRHPSKRATAAELSGRRRARNRKVTVAGGVFTFAAAAAAAVMVGLLLSQGATPESNDAGRQAQSGPRIETITRPAAPRLQPIVETPRGASPSATTGTSNVASSEDTTEPPGPESPFTAMPPSGETPAPAAEAPAATPSAETPTIARGTGGPTAPAGAKGPGAGAVASAPLPLDSPVSDDGSRIELDLSRLAGGLAVKSGAGDTGNWVKLGRKDGAVALKTGDRLRTTGGAFLSLESGTYELSLAPKSELVLRSLAQGPVVGLTDGRVLCEVEKLPSEKHLVVATNAGDFECTGTVFSVAADSQRALLAVEEGTVVCHPQAGDARPVGAGYAVTVARGAAASEPRPMPADANAWARSFRPDREPIYAATFDHDLAGFTGETTEQGAFRGTGRSLLFAPLDPKENNKFWGMAARAPKGRIKQIKPTLDMRLELSVWLEKESHVLVQVMNERQNKYYKRSFGVQPAGRWVTLTVPVMDLETYYDPGKSPMREADLISEIEVYTGDPGESFKALLDDVIVYRKHYR
jgi:ferric-dicitrate binding protein FerR (iron transport regulator)